jgi:uroporphyrinogen-III synthase
MGKMRVLITRPLEQAKKFNDLLNEQGFEGIVDPVLMIESLLESNLNAKEVQAFAVTSLYGLNFLSRSAINFDTPLYVVGKSTYKEAVKRGFRHVFMAEGEVESLANLILGTADSKKGQIIHVSGDVIRGDLVENLLRRGFNAERIIVYKAVEKQSLEPLTVEWIKTGKIQCVVFFSPRTAKIFAKITRHITDCFLNLYALCASKEIALGLEDMRWKEILVAREPTSEAVVELLKIIK